jgi:hypothetical protein
MTLEDPRQITAARAALYRAALETHAAAIVAELKLARAKHYRGALDLQHRAIQDELKRQAGLFP